MDWDAEAQRCWFPSKKREVQTGGSLTTLKEWQIRTHQCSRDHGFYDAPNQTIDQKLMLIVGELAEAHEELRKGHDPKATYYDVIDTPEGPKISDKPEGFGMELADVAIRLLDLCEWQGLDLERLIAQKHAYNLRRPYKHGKVF